MLDRIDKHFRSQIDALNLRAYRQQLLASNIANADTPNYKAVDVDFASALRTASQGMNSLQLSTTSAAHLQAGKSNGVNAQLMYRNVQQPSIDGNTVDIDTELAQFSDNAIHYQAQLTFLAGRFRNLMTAIQGQ